MLLVKLVGTHVVLLLALPIVAIELVLRYLGKPSHLLSWEVASLFHTLWVSWKVMSYDDVPFIRRRILRAVRFCTLLGVAFVFVGKVVLGIVEMDEPSLKAVYPRFCRVAGVVMPHWLIVPAVMFFITNLVVYRSARKSRERANIGAEAQNEGEMVSFMIQVDAPVVFAYLLILPYGLLLGHGSDAQTFFRGMACTLLIVSNLLTCGYDYARLRQLRT
jgi:hypothetical protein